MDGIELLAILTLGAIAPYATEALLTWCRRLGRHGFGAGAPSWFHLPKTRSRV
jgi:hypothetical protein